MYELSGLGLGASIGSRIDSKFAYLMNGTFLKLYKSTFFRHFDSHCFVVFTALEVLISADFSGETLQEIHAKVLFTIMFGITAPEQPR